MKRITIDKELLKNNNDIAQKNRELLKEKNILTINLLGSPGAGKTSILEKIIGNIKRSYNMAVIEGDLYTTKDAIRIEKHNIDVLQVNTGGACHLDASMIEKSLEYIDTNKLDFLVIENIGNLVCPASYDLSEDIKVLVMSVTEGNDKPLKYPSMFQQSSIVILNKIDMIELTDFDKEEFYNDVYSINRDIKVFETSCRSSEGIKELIDYMINQIEDKKSIKSYS